MIVTTQRDYPDTSQRDYPDTSQRDYPDYVCVG